MNRQLKVPTSTIEDVDGMRSFIGDLPKKVRELQHEVDKSLEWYDALEGMRYQLKEDDSKTKFTGLFWPIKINRQVSSGVPGRGEEQGKAARMEPTDRHVLARRLPLIPL